MSKPYQTLSSRVVWSCPWYQVRQDEIITPNGRPGVYNTIEKSDAVWIIPVTADGQIAMIRSYRYTVDNWCWEVPAGSVKPGRSLEETAREELLEEVGGTAAMLEYIAPYYLANGICNEVGHFFLATGVVLGEPHHEAAEVIEVHLKPIDEVLKMARTHQITDGPTALGLLLCADQLALLGNQLTQSRKER